MPYSGPSDASLPGRVKSQNAKWRAQWVAAFNASHAACLKQGGNAKDCESRAFAIATAAAEKAHGAMSKWDDIRQPTR